MWLKSSNYHPYFIVLALIQVPAKLESVAADFDWEVGHTMDWFQSNRKAHTENQWT